jgi:hypothetical protein
VVFEHFDSILGNYEPRSHVLDLDLLSVPAGDISGLDNYFLVDEIWSTIRTMPADKVPGPNSFTCLFYQTAWPVIRDGIIYAFSAFWSLDFRSFYLVNQAYIILLQKTRFLRYQGLPSYMPYTQL